MIWGLKSVFAGLHWYFSLFCMSAFPLFVISSAPYVHYMKDFGFFVVRGVDVDRSSALQDVASTAKEQSFLFYYIILGDSWRGEVPLWGNGGGWVRGLAVASLSISVSIGSHGSDVWL